MSRFSVIKTTSVISPLAWTYTVILHLVISSGCSRFASPRLVSLWNSHSHDVLIRLCSGKSAIIQERLLEGGRSGHHQPVMVSSSLHDSLWSSFCKDVGSVYKMCKTTIVFSNVSTLYCMCSNWCYIYSFFSSLLWNDSNLNKKVFFFLERAMVLFHWICLWGLDI